MCRHKSVWYNAVRVTKIPNKKKKINTKMNFLFYFNTTGFKLIIMELVSYYIVHYNIYIYI